MSLPQTIAIRFTEEDAGYVTVRPVVKQTFRLAELTDMVVCVTGKNSSRVQQIFRAGTVVFNGYRYWWDGFSAEEGDLPGLLAPFPDDDPSRAFDPAFASSVSLETGGGTQRSLFSIQRHEASEKKLFHQRSPWDSLLRAANASSPRYERYSHAEHADVFRAHLTAEVAATLVKELLQASPRGLKKKLAAQKPPSALVFFLPRANSVLPVSRSSDEKPR